MEFNLNDPFELKDVADLINSGDDSKHCQLRVNKDGTVYLKHFNENVNINEVEDFNHLAFRFEIYAAGNNLVGPDAAKDEKFVKKIFDLLKDNWPNPKRTFID
jgi:hypothetical protein